MGGTSGKGRRIKTLSRKAKSQRFLVNDLSWGVSRMRRAIQLLALLTKEGNCLSKLGLRRDHLGFWCVLNLRC